MWKKNVFIVFFFVGSQVIKITTLRTSWLIPYYLFQRSSWTRSPVRYSSATKIVCGSFDRSDSEMRRFPKMTFYEQVRILYDNIWAENTVFENYYKKSPLNFEPKAAKWDFLSDFYTLWCNTPIIQIFLL